MFLSFEVLEGLSSGLASTEMETQGQEEKEDISHLCCYLSLLCTQISWIWVLSTFRRQAAGAKSTSEGIYVDFERADNKGTKSGKKKRQLQPISATK